MTPLLLAVLLAQSWPLDGDGAPFQSAGRVSYIDSPVKGRCAVFNGVDASLRAELPGPAGDFTLSLWILGLDPKGGPVFVYAGSGLTLAEDGRLRFQAPGGKVQTPDGSFAPNQWMHLAVAVQKGRAVLYVNGVEAAALDGAAPAAPTALLLGQGADGRFLAGMMDEVKLFPRALSGDEIAALTDEGMPWLRPKPHARAPFAGKFELLQDDVVVFTGGENARAGAELGYLEALLSLHATGKRVRFRSMAWEGDTAQEQIRPLRFGGWTEQFRRVGATVIFAQFGQVEALQGADGLEGFLAAYDRLLTEFEKTTKRIVLVSPSLYGRAGARQPDLTARNGDLRKYVEGIRALAAKRNFLFVDLAAPPLSGEGVLRDGLHYATKGHWLAAQETARQLQVPGVSELDAPGESGAFRRESLEKLRGAQSVKNGLWNDSWRPSNWAFLNGDRTEQPSSRDHQDRRLRWFPVEIQEYPALLRRQEDAIDGLLRQEKR